MSAFPKFQFAIDRGGTFTDVYARCPSGRVRLMKLLSEDPANYADAPGEGIRRILEQVSRPSAFDRDPAHLAKALPRNDGFGSGAFWRFPIANESGPNYAEPVHELRAVLAGISCPPYFKSFLHIRATSYNSNNNKKQQQLFRFFVCVTVGRKTHTCVSTSFLILCFPQAGNN